MAAKIEDSLNTAKCALYFCSIKFRQKFCRNENVMKKYSEIKRYFKYLFEDKDHFSSPYKFFLQNLVL